MATTPHLHAPAPAAWQPCLVFPATGPAGQPRLCLERLPQTCASPLAAIGAALHALANTSDALAATCRRAPSQRSGAAADTGHRAASLADFILWLGAQQERALMQGGARQSVSVYANALRLAVAFSRTRGACHHTTQEGAR